MKKLTLLLLLFVFVSARSQTSNDAQLNTRLKEYLASSKDLDFNKAMDYMHPKLFTVAPKAQLIEIMDKAFNNPQMKFRFDSMAVVAMSPAYKFETSVYRKIDYHIVMTITLADSINLDDKVMAAAMMQSFQSGFPNKKITLDTAANSIRVAGREVMFAIKDNGSPVWMFLGYERSNPQLLQILYPRQVRQHFKLL